MTPEQIESTGRLAGRAAGGIVSHVEHVHRAIARRAIPTGTAATVPTRVVHEGVSRVVYGIVRGAMIGAGTGSGAVVRVAIRRRGDDIGTTARGNHVMSALNAVVGDGLDRDREPLAITMSVRSARRDVPATAHALRRAFPHATARLAVFLHGLGENEDSWRLHAGEYHAHGTYGTRLEGDFGYTPVYVRYNSGRHVSENGRDLATLLDSVHAHWPVAVDEILLVGHSMGGLVIRAACHYGPRDAWALAVRHVVYLGSPHTGAPLARGARLLAWALDKVPETRPFGRLADHSPGVRDLRFGYVLDDDWRECDGGTCRIDHASEVPLLATADHYVVSAAVAAGPRSPAARLVGDLLVQPSSAHGRGRDRAPLALRAEHRSHHGRLHHFDLLNHPAVYDRLRSWLESPVARDAG